MSISPALMPQYINPPPMVVTAKNKRRRDELERNFDKAIKQRKAAKDSKGYVRDEVAYREADRRTDHVLDLIRAGIDQGRWDY